MLWALIQSLINGLLTGGIYAMVAVGITIIFILMKMFNFAAGGFVTLGMYLTWVLYATFGWDAYILAPFLIIGMSLVAYVVFKLCFQPLLKRGENAMLLVAVGLFYLIPNLIQMIFGAESLTIPSALKDTSIGLGIFSVSIVRLIACGVAIIVILALTFVLSHTNLGCSLRATAENAEISEMLGIHSVKSFTIAFIVGIVLSGLAGLLLTPIYYVTPSTGGVFQTTPFVVVVLGGMGNIKGSMYAGLLVGIAEALVATLIAPELGPLGVFVVYLLVIYLKPEGLFGRGERVG